MTESGENRLTFTVPGPSFEETYHYQGGRQRGVHLDDQRREPKRHLE